MKIEVTEIAGLKSALEALHLPFNGGCKSTVCFFDDTVDTNNEFRFVSHGTISDKDLKLLKTLRIRGDEHAKVLRGVQVWLKITAPIYFWWDLETYVVGHQRLCSESTMHSECKGLSGEELQKVKHDIPFGREITKIDMFSYQTLTRIYEQRINHRLPEFKEFCKFIETLPFYEELIKPIDHEAIITEQVTSKAVNAFKRFFTYEKLVEAFREAMEGGEKLKRIV